MGFQGHQQQFVAEAERVDRDNGWIEVDVKTVLASVNVLSWYYQMAIIAK